MQADGTKVPSSVDICAVRVDNPIYEWYNPFLEATVVCGLSPAVDEVIPYIVEDKELPNDKLNFYNGTLRLNGEGIGSYAITIPKTVSKCIDMEELIYSIADMFVKQLYIIVKFDNIQNFFAYIEQQGSNIIKQDKLRGLYMSNDGEIYAKFPITGTARYIEYGNVFYDQYYQLAMKDITHSVLEYIGCDDEIEQSEEVLYE